MSEPTKFIEANILLAVQQGDIPTAQDKLQEMLTHEVRELLSATVHLTGLCEYEIRRRAGRLV